MALSNHSWHMVFLPHRWGFSYTRSTHSLASLMVQKAIQQLFFHVDWSSSSSSNGSLDILVMDLPPGTGDVPLSLAQLVSFDGSVIVSTPQDVSLADVRKGINMFKKLEVPILGMVLDQTYYQYPTCVESRKEYIFGEPTAFQTLSEESQIPILAHLPLIQAVSSASDHGTPYMLSNLSSSSSINSSSSSSSSSSLSPSSKSWQEGLHAIADGIYTSLHPLTPHN